MSEPKPPVIDYLPAGWTHEKLKTASFEDFESLSPEELEKFNEAQKRHTKALSEYNENVHGYKLDKLATTTTTGSGSKRTAAEREESSEPDDPDTEADADADAAVAATTQSLAKRRDVRAPVQRHVEILQRNGYEKWGFVIIRGHDAGDNEKWSQFLTKWDEMINEQLNDPSSGITREMKDGYRSDFVDDTSKFPSMPANAEEFDEFNAHIESLRLTDVLVDGLDIGMVLFVDREAMESVLNAPVAAAAAAAAVTASVNTTENFEEVDAEADDPSSDAAWIWAVDTDYEVEEEDEDKDEDEEEKYNGRFKVAVSALFEDFWALLVSDALHPTEIWPLADPVFEGI